MKKQLFRIALMAVAIIATACSGDDSSSVNDGDPTNPIGQLRIEVSTEHGNYPQNHIMIDKVVDGNDTPINFISQATGETVPQANVNIGDHIKVRYAIGIEEPLTLKYSIQKGVQVLKSDSATIENNAPFAEFFDITVSVD